MPCVKREKERERKREEQPRRNLGAMGWRVHRDDGPPRVI